MFETPHHLFKSEQIESIAYKNYREMDDFSTGMIAVYSKQE